MFRFVSNDHFEYHVFGSGLYVYSARQNSCSMTSIFALHGIQLVFILMINPSLSAPTFPLFFLLSFPFSLSPLSYLQDSDGHAIKYIMQSLKESPNGSVMALLLGRGIKKEDCSLSAAIRRAGGFKSFCLKHAAIIKWVTDRGGGKVELVKVCH